MLHLSLSFARRTCGHIFLVVMLLASSVKPSNAADWEGVFEGKLGKSSILVQLVEPHEDMEGETGRETSRYSYLPKARDINLMLANAGMPLTFEKTLLLPYEFNSAKGSDRKVTGTWSLTITGETAKGTWSSPDGKKHLPITLTRVPLINEEEKAPDDNIFNATYSALWLKETSFIDAGAAKTFGDVEVRFVKDSSFGIAYPVIGKFPDVASREKINAILMTAHKRSLSRYRDCKNGVPISWEEASGEPEFTYDINFASPTLLSFTESGSVFCGGAHPNNYTKPITYDLTLPTIMGGEYQLDLSPKGFGRLLKLATKDKRIAFEHFALGRWQAAAANESELGGDCATGSIEESPEGEKDFSLFFTEKGLAVLRTDYPHVASVCLTTNFNPTIIAWVDLKPWLKPGQVLLNLP